jgi:hypothetical protein
VISFFSAAKLPSFIQSFQAKPENYASPTIQSCCPEIRWWNDHPNAMFCCKKIGKPGLFLVNPLPTADFSHHMLKMDLESLTGDCESYSTNKKKSWKPFSCRGGSKYPPSYLLQETTQIGPQGEIRPFLLANASGI